MRKAILIALLSVLSGLAVARTQDELIIKANWKLVAQTNAYYLLIDKNLVKETQQGTLVAFQMRIARSDTKEGEEAKKDDLRSVSKIIGVAKAKRVSHEISLIEVDCDRFRLRDLRVWLHDKKSRMVYDFPVKQLEGWRNLAEKPNSTGGKFIEAACAVRGQ